MRDAQRRLVYKIERRRRWRGLFSKRKTARMADTARVADTADTADTADSLQTQTRNASISVLRGLSEDQKVLSLVTMQTKVLGAARRLVQQRGGDGRQYELTSDRMVAYYGAMLPDSREAEMEELLSQYVQLRMALGEGV